MIEDQFILVERVDDTAYLQRRDITAEYLDSFYLEIYEAMFSEEPNPDTKKIVQWLGEFIREVSVYLNERGRSDTNRGEQTPAINRAQARLSSGGWSTTLRLAGDVRVRFGLVGEQDIVVKLLKCQHILSPQPWYELSQCPANQFAGHGHGVRGLYTEMQKILAYRQCFSCKYSDGLGRFCGLGMEMYTGKCAKRVEVLPVIK